MNTSTRPILEILLETAIIQRVPSDLYKYFFHDPRIILTSLQYNTEIVPSMIGQHFPKDAIEFWLLRITGILRPSDVKVVHLILFEDGFTRPE